MVKISKHSFSRYIFLAIAVLACNLAIADSTPIEKDSLYQSNTKKPNTDMCGPRSLLGLECSLEKCMKSKLPSQTCFSTANISTTEQCNFMGGIKNDSPICSDIKLMYITRRAMRQYVFFQCCSTPKDH